MLGIFNRLFYTTALTVVSYHVHHQTTLLLQFPTNLKVSLFFANSIVVGLPLAPLMHAKIVS